MPQTAPLRILVVDDEPAILRTLESFLRLHGYDCQTETDPAAALARLEQEIFHLVITDLVMPGLDGMELVRRLKAGRFLTEVIVMTAFSSLDRALEAYHLGVSDYLLKPFESLEHVAAVVGQAEDRLNRWRQAMVRTMEEGGER
ncbi:MAG: response regulator [Thermodesulfobacteriota bacterium]